MDFAKYMSGSMLYGDDFSIEQIEQWYQEEENAYANIIGNSDSYVYHTLNIFHAYSKLREFNFSQVLGFGSANGKEFLPIINKIDLLSLVDASDSFLLKEINGKAVHSFKAQINGDLVFTNDLFDLITCFGVLHHIPNVSHVFSEIVRCLKTNGYIVIREPIVSMGNWNEPRKGLTVLVQREMEF